MNEMEQPINQNLLMEDECEKLHNVGVESNNISTNRSTEESVSQTLNGSIKLGKFKDAESLLKAYNSLQTEFTKKSQRLSELENSKTDFAREEKINEAINELTQNHTVAQQFVQQIKEAVKDKDVENYSQTVKEELLKNLEQNYKSASDLIADPQFLNDYVYTNSTIRENIIRDYLSNFTNITRVGAMFVKLDK